MLTPRCCRPAVAALVASTILLPSAIHGQSKAPAPFAFGKEELKLLAEADAIDRQLERQGLVYHDAALEQYLAKLAKPLLPDATPDRVEWRFRILREPLINAQALPNGSIYVNTSMLAMLENDDQLAGVLAHEITHVTNRHTFEFARNYRKKAIASEVLALGMAWVPVGGIVGSTVWAMANVGEVWMAVSLYGYSRADEREADENAVALLKRSGGDPAQLTRAFALFEERLDPEPVHTFWRTHPKTEQRIGYISDMLDGRKIEKPALDPAYLERMRSVTRHNLRLDLESRRFRTALARARRLADNGSPQPEDLFWLGEAYRLLGPRTAEPSEHERTDDGQNAAYRKAAKRTQEEEERALAATPDGKAALASNQSNAERAYREALARDPHFAKPHVGLGLLYEQEGQAPMALAEFRQYLELAPAGEDRLRVEHRIQALEGRL